MVAVVKGRAVEGLLTRGWTVADPGDADSELRARFGCFWTLFVVPLSVKKSWWLISVHLSPMLRYVCSAPPPL